MKDNKLLIISFIINIILIVILITLNIKLNESNNQKESTKYTDSNDTKYYHCESKIINYDYYTFSKNYDFIIINNEISTSSFYEKYLYSNIDEFNKTISDEISDEETNRIIDNEKSIEYYPLKVNRKLNGDSLENYIKRIEEEFEMTCKESTKEEIKMFN